MGQLETSLLQETIYSLKFSLESQRLCSCHCSRDSRESRFTVGVTAQMFVLHYFHCMKIGVWGFTTQDVIRYHVLPLHPGCPLQVSGKTQNRQWELCICCYCIISPPRLCIREFHEPGLFSSQGQSDTPQFHQECGNREVSPVGIDL